MKRILACILVWLSLGITVEAAIVEVRVEGVVDTVSTAGNMALDGSVEVGSVINGYCRYDSEVSGLSGGQINESYPVINVIMSVGNYEFTHNSQAAEPALFKVSMVNRVYSVSTEAPAFDGLIYIGDTPKIWSDVSWSWGYMNLLNLWTSSLEYWQTPVLPDAETFPPLDIFDLRRKFEVRMYGQGDDYFGIYGEITSLRVVPEPVSVLLMGLGGLSVLMRKRRRK